GAALGTLALAQPAQAQETLSVGEAYATRFSGTIAITLGDGSRLSLIDETGVVGSAIDVRRPGFPADGRHWIDEPQHMAVTAGEIGQVFGIAFDDGSPANVYLTATSAFGLHRYQDASDWLPGQWGEGGPGGLYVLRGAEGYAPSLLTTITLDGRENSGAGLGNVAFDPASKQLFVSDLESGMIHRLALDGTEIERFDHGATGRPSFTDASTGAAMSLAAVAFDPASAASIEDCTDSAGVAAEFDLTPSCWNYADFRRRVWGLAVHTDAVTGATRLYYAISGADSLGHPDWESAGEDSMNSVWSIGLSEGAFNPGDVRREVILPELGDETDAPRSVPDLAISPEGVMLVAERGSVRNLGLDAADPFATPHGARVLRYLQSDTDIWVPDGRYDVGFNDRKSIGAPHIRANAAGGVDFGYGYDAAGSLDTSKPAGSVWASGDALCSPDGACFDPKTGTRSDASEVHGLQGTPVEASDELLPAGAGGAYPDSGEPYPADALLSSYMIDLDRNVDDSGAPLKIEALKNDATKIGDVEVYKAGAAPTRQGGGYDIDIDKSGALQCLPGASCSYVIRLTNKGTGIFSGPLYLWDVIQPFPVGFVSVVGTGWSCFDLGTGIQCVNAALTIEIGQTVELTVVVGIPAIYRSGVLTNCVAIQWLYDENGAIDARAIQVALKLLGYDPGVVDGVFGQQSHDALAEFQADNGLDPTGEIDEATVALLYPGLIGIEGDLDGSNDMDCHDVSTGVPEPVHSKWNSHLKVGSPHGKVQSHLKIGSPHNKVQSHRKTGSLHGKVESHRKVGSGHEKRQSHLKQGSLHGKIESHRKIGSGHSTRQSHLKQGSIHNKDESHRKIGSGH
ncbi:MAG: peptidoglycan-binding domain-containing protein, partial [Mesorhizobium sp.]|nr:peptidoglycan-binding domain-containing protein [Mesorhizobium sp.]